jgi:hypothetical protein
MNSDKAPAVPGWRARREKEHGERQGVLVIVGERTLEQTAGTAC